MRGKLPCAFDGAFIGQIPFGTDEFRKDGGEIHAQRFVGFQDEDLYRAGMPLVLLSEFLGHADVNTTRIYAWADTEMKRQAIQKVSKPTAEDSIEPIWANDEEMIKRLYGLA